MVAKIGSWLLDMERWRVNIIFKGQVFFALRGYRVEGQFLNLSIDITHIIREWAMKHLDIWWVFVCLWKAIEISFLNYSRDIKELAHEKASQSMLWSGNWNGEDQNLVSFIPWTSLEDFFEGLSVKSKILSFTGWWESPNKWNSQYNGKVICNYAWI